MERIVYNISKLKNIIINKVSKRGFLLYIILCPGKAGIRLGCTSVKTLETDAIPRHRIISP